MASNSVNNNVSALHAAQYVVGNLVRDLKDQGTTAHQLDNMVNMVVAFETAGLSHMLDQDGQYALTQ